MTRIRLLVGLTAAVGLVAGSVLGAPRLTIPESSFDYGFVPQNSQISHVFWLHSTGDDTLKIIRIDPGCSCTRAPLEKQEIAAGDSTRLEIFFDTRTYTNKAVKRPRIQTNEGEPDKYISFTADVVARPDSTYPIVIKPYKLDLTQFGDKVRSDISFTIENLSQQALEPKLVGWPKDLVEVGLPKSIPAGKTAEGNLKLKPKALEIEFKKSITLQLNDEKSTRFTIPIMRTVRASSAQPADTAKAAVGK